MTVAIEEREGLRADAKSSRLEILRGAMSAAGVDLAIVYGSGQGAGRPNPCWYFSGVKPIGPDTCLVVPLSGEPVLVTTPMWDEDRTRALGWIDDVIAVDAFVETIDELATSRGWTTRRVGFMGLGSASVIVAGALRQIFAEHGADFDVFDEIVRVHDDLSLFCVERSIAIAEEGYRCILETAEPGMTEYELGAACELTTRSLGADDNFQFVAASQRHTGPRPSQNRQLFEGDVIIAEISPGVDGQFAQICRSAALGSATDDQYHTYAILQEALAAGLSTCMPGHKVGEIATAVNDVIASYGFGEFNRQPYHENRGHGLGRGSRRPNGITVESEDVLEVGMSFVLHPNQYFPISGYLLCGDQVVIEESGARIVATRPPALEVISVR